MNLVKVGDRYINLDLVYQISFNDKQREQHPEVGLQAELDVAFPVSTYPDGPEDATGPLEAAGMRVFGEEAEALRHYLHHEAVRVDEQYQQHLDSQERQKKLAEWGKQYTAFCDAKGIEYPEKDNYRGWLMGDYEEADIILNPTDENYVEFKEWAKEYEARTFSQRLGQY